MARLFDDGSSEYLDAGSSPSTSPPLTVAAWFYSDDATHDSQPIVAIGNDANDTTNFYRVHADSDGAVKAVAYNDATLGVAATSTSWSADTWHHACGVFSATNSRAVYLDGGGKVTNSTSVTPTVNKAMIGGLQYSDAPAFTPYFSGRICHAAIWSAALTDAEVALLAAKISPLLVRPQSLVAYWPLNEASDADIVGGYHMTAYNTPSWAESVPVTMPGMVILPGVSAGGTVYQQSAAGVWTPSGAVVKATSKYWAGALTPAGTVVKATSTDRAGALTPAGTVTKETARGLAGAASWAGAVVKATSRGLAGALTSAGAVAKATSRGLAGAVTFAGAATKTAGKALAGTLTLAGVVGTAPRKALAGALTLAGTVTKATSRGLAGALTFTGAAAKKMYQSLAGAISFVGALATEHIGYAMAALVRRFTPGSEDRTFDVEEEDRELEVD